MDALEFAIKKDVHNSPLVREVDRDRHREMWRTLGVGMLLVVALVFSAWQHFELLQYGRHVAAIQEDLGKEDELARRLRLEIEMLKSPARIERLATTTLHMVVPGPRDTTIVERVVPADAPPQSVVARR